MLQALAGVVIGSLLTGLVTYGFQKKLLRQQLEAQEKSHQEMIRTIGIASNEVLKQCEKIASIIGAAAQRAIIG